MLQPFFENNIQTTYIKSMLYNTPLPNYSCAFDGDYIFEGMTYVFNNNFILCTSSGILRENITTITLNDEQLANYEITKKYKFGTYYTNLTSKCRVNNSFYDTQTHRYLGQYLKCWKSCYDIDLMQMYNCYPYIVYDDCTILNTSSYYLKFGKRTDGNVLLVVPIELDRTYTIYTSELSNLILCPIIRDDSGYLCTIGDTDDSSEFKFSSIKPIEVDGVSLTNGYEYTFSTPKFTVDDAGAYKSTEEYLESSELYKYEKYIYLAIQFIVPVTTNYVRPSLIVLDGEKKTSSVTVNMVDENGNSTATRIKNALSKSQQESLFYSEPELLNEDNYSGINKGTVYAYNEKLIQFLTKNAITNLETIDNNVTRIQEWLGVEDLFEFEPDTWNFETRLIAYTKYMAIAAKMNDTVSEYDTHDVTGYIDSDMERCLFKYRVEEQ